MRFFNGKAGIMKSGRFLRNNFRDECYGYSSSSCTAEEGMEMVSSVVAYYKWLFLKDAKSLDIQTESLTEDELNFWTYYYYNRGSGKDTLQKLIKNGVFDDSAFIRAKPGEVIQNGCNARHNAIITAANSKFIRDLGIFA